MIRAVFRNAPQVFEPPVPDPEILPFSSLESG